MLAKEELMRTQKLLWALATTIVTVVLATYAALLSWEDLVLLRLGQYDIYHGGGGCQD